MCACTMFLAALALAPPTFAHSIESRTTDVNGEFRNPLERQPWTCYANISRLDSSHSPNRRTAVIHGFSSSRNAIQGITEMVLDIFAVDDITCDIPGNQSCTFGSG